MSKQLVGQGVARGIVIGRAHLLAPSELDIRQYHIQRGDVLHEVARLNNAFSLVRAELEQLRTNVAGDAPAEVKAFLDLHRMILDDSLLCDAPRDLVEHVAALDMVLADVELAGRQKVGAADDDAARHALADQLLAHASVRFTRSAFPCVCP